jgi:hypothetical protein
MRRVPTVRFGTRTNALVKLEVWYETCSDSASFASRILSQVSPKMLSQCANSQCGKPFLKLREGKLFLVETDRVAKPGESVSPPFVRARQPQRLVEHFWLCDECAPHWTLIYDGERGITLVPLRRALARAAAAPERQSGAA